MKNKKVSLILCAIILLIFFSNSSLASDTIPDNIGGLYTTDLFANPDGHEDKENGFIKITTKDSDPHKYNFWSEDTSVGHREQFEVFDQSIMISEVDLIKFFLDDNGASGNKLSVADFATILVPEPTSIGLIVFGLIGIVYLARRKNAK